MQVDHCVSAQSELDWLAQRVRAAHAAPQVLFCHYRDPAVIFGLSQRPDAALRQALANAGVDWMRRRAGGGTVYAGPWLLGISVILPADHALHGMEPMQAYRWFGGLWQSALLALGCDSHLPDSAAIRASRRRAEAQGVDWACYGAMGHGELGTAGSAPRKLLGVAQIRTRTASTLVAGLSLEAADWHSLCGFLQKPAVQGDYLAAANVALADLMPAQGSTTAEALARRVEASFVPRLARAIGSQCSRS